MTSFSYKPYTSTSHGKKLHGHSFELINVWRTCARGLQYSLCVCVCVCVCVSAVFWLHKMFKQHFDNGNRLCAKRKRFSTHRFLWEGFFRELQPFLLVLRHGGHFTLLICWLSILTTCTHAFACILLAHAYTRRCKCHVAILVYCACTLYMSRPSLRKCHVVILV